jgi:hypothetical protein
VLLVSSALASCGAQNCVLDLRGPEESAARYSFDLAYQFIDQDQVRVGSKRGRVGEIAADHNEIETRTESWLMTGRGRFGSALLVTASLPYIDRTHRHEDTESGTPEEESWSFTGLGDLTVLGTYTPGGAAPENGTQVSLQLGIKAPTGKTEVDANEAGEQPEPSARPSTGSWDGLGGVQLRRWFATRTLAGEHLMMPFTIGVLGRVNGKGTDDFQAGNEVQINGTGGWALSPHFSLLAQINSRFKVKDTENGVQEENSGGQAVYISPGLRAAFGHLSAFGYVQLRAYERVNGIQVTAPMHVMIGTSYGL